MQRPVTFTCAEAVRIGNAMARNLPDSTAHRWREYRRDLAGSPPVAQADAQDWRVATRWLASMALRSANVSGFAARLP